MNITEGISSGSSADDRAAIDADLSGPILAIPAFETQPGASRASFDAGAVSAPAFPFPHCRAIPAMAASKRGSKGGYGMGSLRMPQNVPTQPRKDILLRWLPMVLESTEGDKKFDLSLIHI